MPNYSKKGYTTYTNSEKTIDSIPWSEAAAIYANSYESALETKQRNLDYAFKIKIEELEEEYNDNNEAPYEGNFSDKYNKPVAKVSTTEVLKACKEELQTNFIARYSLQSKSDWLMPLLVTLVGNMSTTTNSNGLISGLRFRNDNFNTTKLKGIYWLLMQNEKSSFLKLLYKSPSKHYGGLVPFIMYAQRLVRGIKYSEWDKTEVAYIVNSSLAEAMLYPVPKLDKSVLLHERAQGLITKTTGLPRSPLSTHKLYGTQLAEGPLAEVPELARVMLTQIWQAHPDNRTKYMILDPLDWDSMPDPLIPTKVLMDLTTTNTDIDEMPWNI